MKYIDADKLIANLKRQNVDKKVIEPLIRIIDSLQQEQQEEPDKSLEKAADEWAENETYGKSDAEFEMAYKGFITGAEWQKEQDERVYREFFNERNQGDASFRDLLAYKEGHRDGMEEQASQMLKDAVEGEAEELYNDGESQCVVSVGTYFKPGDKVYVLKAEEE